MRNLHDASDFLARAYLGLVEDAMKEAHKSEGKTLYCCKCKKSNVTLRKIHPKHYACESCIRKRMGTEAIKEYYGKENF